jgi:nucleoside-diphosphate-sugar epimerase
VRGKVVIIGGTGFLGYHAARALAARGWQVTAVARRPPPPGLFPLAVRAEIADAERLSSDQARALVQGHDALVFAAGADDRSVPRAPAYPHFHRANVETAARLIAAARDAGLRKAVLLGSYFAHFARQWPELRLAERHPYIRSRCAQEEACLGAAAPSVELAILRLPYIFGAMPGRPPLWKPLIAYLARTPLVLYTRGGSNAVAVERVAEAIAGALERPSAGVHLVGDENLTWAALLRRLLRRLGRRKRVITLPTALVSLAALGVRVAHRLRGKEGGLDPAAFVALQTRETFFDPGPARTALGIGSGGLDEALAETIASAQRE